MRRAIFLLAFLPTLAQAAPAPFPRERRDPDARTWSKPVDGLRVRLVAHSMRYKLYETMRLTLEIQNVSNSDVLLEDPHLRGTVHPAAPRGWAITGARAQELGQLEKRQHRQVEEFGRRLDVVRLAAGHVHRIEIRVDAGLTARKVEPVEEGKPRREYVYFLAADAPGLYELRATFRRGAPKGDSLDKKGWWSGDALTSPPVRIELHE